MACIRENGRCPACNLGTLIRDVRVGGTPNLIGKAVLRCTSPSCESKYVLRWEDLQQENVYGGEDTHHENGVFVVLVAFVAFVAAFVSFSIWILCFIGPVKRLIEPVDKFMKEFADGFAKGYGGTPNK